MKPRIYQGYVFLRGGRLPVVLLLTALTLPAPAQSPQPPTPEDPGATLRVEVNLVDSYCTVKNKQGMLVNNLKANDFEVFEDGKRQEVRYFSRETDTPLALVLLVDTSVSQKEVLAREKQTVGQFLRQVIRPVDQALLITFDALISPMPEFTSETAQLEQVLARTHIRTHAPAGPDPSKPPGGTRLYDAIHLAARQKLAPEMGRKAIIIIGDGVDFGSGLTQQQALEAAQRGDAIIYAIGLADPSYYWRRTGRSSGGDDVLRDLARETGGRAIFPSSLKQLPAAFEAITEELRSQYRIGYLSNNRTRDGRFRKIQISVKRKGLRVQARRGYYAPGS